MMSLLLPIGLLSLLALPIIVALHMLRIHPQRHVIPSLQHWQNITQRAQGKQRPQLPITLMLALHLLVAACVGLALAAPFLRGVLGEPPQHTAIVIDVSTSMASQAGASTRLALAKERARTLLAELGPQDSASIVLAGPHPRVLVSARSANLSDALAALDTIHIEGNAQPIDQALALAQASIPQQTAYRVVVLSDGYDTRQAAGLSWEVLGSGQDNRAVVTLSERRVANTRQIFARIANYGDKAYVGTVRLYGDQSQIEQAPLELLPNSDSELVWELNNNYDYVSVQIDGQDGQPLDDQAHLVVKPPVASRILLVSNQTALADAVLPRALRAAGATVSMLQSAQYEAQTTALDRYDLVIFDGYTPSTWPELPVWLINPPVGERLIRVSESLFSPEGSPQAQSALFEGLSLEAWDFQVVQQLEAPVWANPWLVLSHEAFDPLPLVLGGTRDSYRTVIWTFDPNNEAIATRLAFPLLVSRTVRELLPNTLPSSLVLGDSPRLDVSDDTVVLVQSPQGAQSQVLASDLQRMLNQAGIYQLRTEERDYLLAVNAGSVGEADLRQAAVNAPAPAEFVMPQQEREQMPGSHLWPWLLFIALAVLMFEWGYSHR
jgi:Ca-activated chloride channel family protein